MTKDLTFGKVLDLDMETLQNYGSASVTATATGTTLTTDKYNRLNKARNFDGSSDSIDCGSDSSLDTTGNYSVGIWFNGILGSANRLLIGRYDGAATKGYAIRYSSTETIQFYHVSQGSTEGGLIYNNCVSSSAYTGWHRILATFEVGVGSKLYVDGELVSSASTTTVGISSFANNLLIGKQSGVSPLYFDDTLFKPDIWNRALDATEVQQDYAEVAHNYQGLFDGLVAGYDFRGDAKDFSGNGNDGVETNITYTTDYLNVDNSCAVFNGTSSNVSIPDSLGIFDGSQEYSYGGWIKFTDVTPNQVFITFKGERNTEMQTAASDERLLFYTGFAALYTGTLLDDTWYFIIGTYSPTSGGSLYVNGELVDSDSGTGSIAARTTNSVIGKDTALSARHLGGNIGRMIITNHCLSANENKVLYDLTKSGYIYPYPQNRTSGITE